jgi:Ca2+-binding RTX toxin-like protein
MIRRWLCASLGASLFTFTLVALPSAPATASGPEPGATKTIARSATLETEDQPMWGGTNLLGQNIEWFDVAWDERGSFGDVDRVCLDLEVWKDCGNFGAEITASLQGEMRMGLELEGFDGGTLDVTYPVDVEFTAPADNSFDPGDTIEIATAIEVDETEASVTGDFPRLGSIAWTGGFHAAGEADARMCFISCDRKDLFDFEGGADGAIVRFEGSDLADGCFDTIFDLPMLIGLGMDRYDSGRCPNILGESGAPYLMNPNPSLVSAVNADGTVSASGSDLYSVIPTSGVTWAFRGMGVPWWVVPNLNPVGYRGASIGWTSFNTIITALETMRQDLKFHPDVQVTLDWGDELDFTIVDPDTGETVQDANGSAATFTAGHTLRLTTPAVGSKIIPVTPTLSMGDAEMSNHTRSVSSGNVEVKALSFNIKTDRERVCIDEIGCATWWPGTNTTAGPLLQKDFPIAPSANTLFNGTFSIGGFDAVELAPFDVVPRPLIEVRKNVVPHNAPGTFDLAINGTIHTPGARDGDSTGPVVVDPGDISISETAGPGADLRYYDITITCRHRDDGTTHTAGAGTQPGLGSSMSVTLTGGEDLICTVRNRLPVPAECDSMTFDNVILGTPGADVDDLLIGTIGRDIIVGYGGNDTLIGLPGDDCLAGNAGDDIINAGEGNDIIDGGSGNDVCTAGIIGRRCTVNAPNKS